MGSYGQWASRRELRRLVWVCGSEPVLSEDVVSEALSKSGDHVTLTAGEVPERDIWAAVSSPLADPDSSLLVIIRSAQKLRRWDQLPAIIAARDLAQIRVLFVSDEEKLAQVPGEEGKTLAPHLALLRDSRLGQLVECRVPDDWRDTPAWLLDWASRQLGGGALGLLGEFLLSATGGSLAEAAAVGAKLRMAGMEPSRESIAALAEPAVSFTEALIGGRKAAALAAAGVLTHEETGRAIGMLASRLDVLAALHAASERRLDARDTAVKAGVPMFLQQRYRSVSAAYSRVRVDSCRALLAVADEAWRAGADDGVGEFVAAGWAS